MALPKRRSPEDSPLTPPPPPAFTKPTFNQPTEPAVDAETVIEDDNLDFVPPPVDETFKAKESDLDEGFPGAGWGSDDPEEQEIELEHPIEAEYTTDPEELAERKREQEVLSLSDSAKQSAQLLLERIMDDKCSEVLMNGPKNIMVKENGNRLFMNDISFENVDEYHSVINNLILYDTDTADRIGDGKSEHLIEGQLELPDYDNPDNPPLFARVHILTPPVVKAAKVTIAKKAKRQFRIDDFISKGTMSQQMGLFLKACARGKATMVFSGLSGAGKTTLLEAMSHEFDENDRLVVVEDTAELRLPVYDVVPLLATSRKPGQDIADVVTLEWLVAQANRMRPDRIIVGESRGGEFAEFLTAANSGADGSLTTIHASSSKQAVDKMRSLAMKSSHNRTEQSVTRDIASTVQIIIQMALIDGQHIVTQIDELSDVVTGNGGIGIQPLFEYDRNGRRFVAKGQPSEKLAAFLAGRGVQLDRAWFARI